MEQEEKPKIIIAGKDTSMENLSKIADETRVSRFQPLPREPIEGPEGEKWAPWLVTERKEVEDIQNPSLRVEIQRLARRPEVMVDKDTLKESYESIDGLVEKKEISRDEADKWLGPIVMRYAEMLEKEGRGSTKEDLLNALPPTMVASFIHFADELAERVPEKVINWLRNRRWFGGRRPPGAPKEEELKPEDTFAYVHDKCRSDSTTEEERQKVWMPKRARMVIEGGRIGLFDQASQSIINTLKTNRWNDERGTIQDKIASLADRLESEAHGVSGYKPWMEGMVRAAVIGASLEISAEGYAHRPFVKGSKEEDAKWLEEHGVSKEQLDRLKERARREAFLPLGYNPRDYVGVSLSEANQERLQREQEREKAIEELMKRVRDEQKAQFDNLAGPYQAMVEDMREVFGRVDPEQERANWVDLEYRQEFWARFEPRSWPRFYEKASFAERRIWEARWLLARSAFHKRITAAFPEKYVENQDLILLGKKEMELLFEIEGVPKMLQRYTELFLTRTPPDGKVEADKKILLIGEDGKPMKDRHGNDRRITIWECGDQATFEALRRSLRLDLVNDPKFAVKEVKDLPEKDALRIKMARAKEADAVAWNLLFVSHLAESADSRYSYSGRRHLGLPGAIAMDEYRTVLHPQERAEHKWNNRHSDWGRFGEWGTTQITRIEQIRGFDKEKDELFFTPANRGAYWTYRRRDIKEIGPLQDGKSGVVEVFVPECYPVTTVGSFLEDTRASGKPLMEYIRKGEKIPWDDVEEDAWAIYVTTKFFKASNLFDYFMKPKPTLTEVEDKENLWAGPLKELFIRVLRAKQNMRHGGYLYKVRNIETVVDGEQVRQNKLLAELRDGQPVESYQTFHNLKVWAAYAGYGGVGDPRNPDVSKPVGAVDWGVQAIRFRGRKLRYLEGGIIGESLDIEKAPPMPR